jgi:Uma2 family endonuclease
MAATVVRAVSVDEYLNSPEFEHCEYIDGQAVEMNVGNEPHSSVQGNCVAALVAYFRQRGTGKAYTEFRCRLSVGGRQRFYQPDVAVVLGPRQTGVAFLDRAPDLAVEIKSPSDSIPDLMQKIQHYLANGSKLVWLILPEDKSVISLRPSDPLQVVIGEEVLGAPDVLPEFKLPLPELFD